MKKENESSLNIMIDTSLKDLIRMECIRRKKTLKEFVAIALNSELTKENYDAKENP